MKRLLLGSLLGCMLMSTIQASQLANIAKDYMEQASYTFASDNIKNLNVAKGFVGGFLAISAFCATTTAIHQSNAVANIADLANRRNIFENGNANDIPSLANRMDTHCKTLSFLTFWGILCAMLFKPEWVGCAHLQSDELFPSAIKPLGHWAYGTLAVSLLGSIGNNGNQA
jgi:hypothetical protein